MAGHGRLQARAGPRFALPTGAPRCGGSGHCRTVGPAGERRDAGAHGSALAAPVASPQRLHRDAINEPSPPASSAIPDGRPGSPPTRCRALAPAEACSRGASALRLPPEPSRREARSPPGSAVGESHRGRTPARRGDLQFHPRTDRGIWRPPAIPSRSRGACSKGFAPGVGRRRDPVGRLPRRPVRPWTGRRHRASGDRPSPTVRRA